MSLKLQEIVEESDVSPFEEHESNVRSYCRSFPVVFAHAKGALVTDEQGREYIDFFAGAGALNYGHNPEAIKDQLIAYLQSEGIIHALDMYTGPKREFLRRFASEILAPRGLDYRIQFCGPTGTNAVEAALKLARLATGRPYTASFTGGWHGMSLGSLAVTGNRAHREAAGMPLGFNTFFPFPGEARSVAESLAQIEAALSDANGGTPLPAAIIVETVQAEGGIHVAPVEWLRGLRTLCDRFKIVLIVDDIQAGCGRTGRFFSFERAGIVPDMVTVSKSISGYGLPMSLVLIKPELDVWKPADHTGTFRGMQLSLLAATAALDYWKGPDFEAGIEAKRLAVEHFFAEKIRPLDARIRLRGLGLIFGIELADVGGPELAKQVARACFQQGLILERCGRDDTVLKILPPLTIELDQLLRGCEIIRAALADALPRT